MLGAGEVLRIDRRPGLARLEAGENFPVALRVLPRGRREGLHAVYAFARTVDELGDAPGVAPAERVVRLTAFAAELEHVWTDGRVHDPVLRRLRPVVEAHAMEAEPFRRLVRANLQDQRVVRYETFDDLLGYCRLSADPVGRIVLALFDLHDPALAALSDRVCTALQLLEHWQDVAEDRRAGRVYLPQQDLRAYDVVEADLDAAQASPRLRALMLFEIDRAAALLADGAPLVGALHGWARPCVAGFVAGGAATVAALRRTGGEVLARTARPSRAGTLARALRLVVAA